MLLMATNFTLMFAIYMLNTTLPLYLTALGASVSLVGIISGSFAATAIGVRPFAGPAFDAFPRKMLLVITQIISFTCIVGYAFASTPTTVLIFRLIHGIGIGCAGPLAMSMLGDFVPPEKFATGVSVYATSTSAAQAIGPAAGLFFADALGFRALYLVCSGFLVASFFCVFFVKEKPRQLLPYKVEFSRSFAKEVFGHTLVIALLSIACAAISYYLALMGREYGIDNVGFFFAIYAVSLIVVTPQYGKLSDRFGNERVLIMGLAFFALSLVMLHFAHSVPLLMITAVVSSLGYGASAPQVQSLAMRATDISRSAVVNNTYFTGVDVGFLLGPTLAGIVSEAIQQPGVGGLGQAYSDMWLFMIIPVALAFLIVIKWNIRLSRKKKESETH